MPGCYCFTADKKSGPSTSLPLTSAGWRGQGSGERFVSKETNGAEDHQSRRDCRHSRHCLSALDRTASASACASSGPLSSCRLSSLSWCLWTPWGKAGIQGASNGVSALLGYADHRNRVPFRGQCGQPAVGQLRARRLPVIIFFASLVSILYYLGVMQRVVRWVGGAIGWVTGISRVESLGAAANIFVGQSESPLVVRPYLAALAPVAAVRADGGRHGGSGGYDPRRLCRTARARLPAVPARRRGDVRARAAS